MREVNLMSDEFKFNLEEMSEFFNKRAKTYDKHMSEVVEKFEDYYDTLSSPMGESGEKIKVLDIGCGTGLELEGIFKRNPEAEVDVIDMSEEMLTILKEKYKDKLNQIKIIHGSYLTIPFNQNYYDYVIASMTIHHFTKEEKVCLYKKINSTLINGGTYIEGDYYMLSKEEEEKCLDFYYDAIDKIPKAERHLYHIDIPFTIETENELLSVSGFTNIYKKLEFGEKCILVGEKII
jgi:tRNA (cmo5U34)-methyltransferase